MRRQTLSTTFTIGSPRAVVLRDVHLTNISYRHRKERFELAWALLAGPLRLREPFTPLFQTTKDRCTSHATQRALPSTSSQVGKTVQFVSGILPRARKSRHTPHMVTKCSPSACMSPSFLCLWILVNLTCSTTVRMITASSHPPEVTGLYSYGTSRLARQSGG